MSSESGGVEQIGLNVLNSQRISPPHACLEALFCDVNDFLLFSTPEVENVELLKAPDDFARPAYGWLGRLQPDGNRR
ncbi:hypothetical protein H6F89_33850 [Cyanobacteria bacterium FACHB-63]|nr:hypothetical protein [Cyanobacteria bacterium FACHB-63]